MNRRRTATTTTTVAPLHHSSQQQQQQQYSHFFSRQPPPPPEYVIRSSSVIIFSRATKEHKYTYCSTLLYPSTFYLPLLLQPPIELLQSKNRIETYDVFVTLFPVSFRLPSFLPFSRQLNFDLTVSPYYTAQCDIGV